MAQPQTAICAEGENFGIFITALVTARPDAAAIIRRTAARLHQMTAETAARVGEPALCAAIGFGAGIWSSLFGEARPAELAPFPAMAQGARQAPATPADLFIHIHSGRHDANFVLARAVMGALGDAVRVVEEVHGFKYLGGRDLTGFVDGTENPKGDERPGVALVGDEDAAFAAGSYVSIQRYVHKLAPWEALPVHAQEQAVGRTKEDDEELEDDAKPASAHISRVVIEEDGEELEVLRHSLPYGTTAEHGLYFVAYCSTPVTFRKMLERMVMADGDGAYDRLLDFTTPVTGASFFVPSVEFLAAKA
jgi:putative iron-dependent peroxidase